LVVSLLVVCPGAGTVVVSVTVLVWPGVVTVLVGSGVVTVLVGSGVVTVWVGLVSFACVVVAVRLSADWTAVLALVAAVETACCNVPDPQAVRAQAAHAPAISAPAMLAARLVGAAFLVGSKVSRAGDTEPSVGGPIVGYIIRFG
jgi:hypothetical protein